MASRILRRSGVAMINIAELLDWAPEVIVQVGVGNFHQEVDVMKQAWPGVKFFGFEPEPNIYRETKKSYPGRLLDVAVSDEPVDFRPFYSKHKHADGSSLIGLSPRKPYNVFTVSVTTLDQANSRYNFINGSRQRVLLWLDCEGSELAALRGGAETLKRVDVVNVEMTSKPPNPDWPSPVEVHNHLIDSGFLRQSVHTNRSGAGQCDCIYVRKTLFRPEICCCPCMLGGKGCS